MYNLVILRQYQDQMSYASSMATASGLLGDGKKAIKIHHLVKLQKILRIQFQEENHGMQTSRLLFTKPQKICPMEHPVLQLQLFLEPRVVFGGGNLDVHFVDILMMYGMMLPLQIFLLNGKRLNGKQMILTAVR